MTELQKLMATKAIKNPAENNPAIIHKFSADPAVLVYNDTVYIYATNDAQQAEITKCKEDNAYNKITNLNIFSSKDLVNWTDCGEIAVAGKQNPKGAAKWANNSWAPAICTKKINGKDKFFLYFADNGSGIGVLTADSPTGPFTDPIGKQLVARSTPNCAKVYWLFDPAVCVDDDGTGYLYFGGGVDKDPAHPKSGRCVKLGDDMISLAGTPEEIDAPWLFEDSGINKIGNKYYYTYCSNWAERGDAKGPDVPPVAVIAYMTSDSPLGPFTYQGYTLQNPGTLFGAWGNNHHWIFQFKGKHYIAFHAQFVEKAMGNEKGGYRNICITDFKVKLDTPYPEIIDAQKSPKTVAIIKNQMAGNDGELRAILQYFYQSSISHEIEPEISDILEEISIVEMTHLDLLSLAIVNFGGEPRYENGANQYFSTSQVSYYNKLKEALDANIAGEEKAIYNYQTAITQVENESLKRLFERIIEDEKLHIKIFKYLKDTVKFLSI